MSDRKYARRAEYLEQKAIEKLLRTVCKKQDNGAYSYEADWTDEKVAKAIAEDLSGASTQYVRKAIKMPLVAARSVGAVPKEVEVLVAELNLRISHIERVLIAIADGLGVDHKSSGITALSANGVDRSNYQQ